MTLEKMCMLDRFLFSEAMEDPWIHRFLLETIFQRNICLKQIPVTEKEIRNHPEKRSIRLDGWAVDEQGRGYNTEDQKRNTGNLPRRSRFYQGSIDRNLLARGMEDFNELPDCAFVMIMPFDLMGQKKYRYTFRQKCDETGEPLKDGAVRIFLNIGGKDAKGCSRELVELLEYMETGNLKPDSSENIRELDRRIGEIKRSRETEEKYMQLWEEIAMEKREAREEGLREGREEGRKGIRFMVKFCMDRGIPQEEIMACAKQAFSGEAREDCLVKLFEEI